MHRPPPAAHPTGEAEPLTLSDQLERWLTGDGEKTLGSLVHTFGDKSFAILLVLLLGVPALPLPTGGVTHVFELIAALIALELIAGRHEVWLPQRWRALELAGPRQQRFITGLMRMIRRLERYSRPRRRFLFHRRFTDILFGVLAIAGTPARSSRHRLAGLTRCPPLAWSFSHSGCSSKMSSSRWLGFFWASQESRSNLHSEPPPSTASHQSSTRLRES